MVMPSKLNSPRQVRWTWQPRESEILAVVWGQRSRETVKILAVVWGEGSRETVRTPVEVKLGVCVIGKPRPCCKKWASLSDNFLPTLIANLVLQVLSCHMY